MSLDAHRHKKQLGQHFLSSPGVVEKILRAIDPKPGEFIVEIGPGAGALTFPLLRAHGALTVIEFDRDLVEPLAIEGAKHGRLTVLHRDVLQVDFARLGQGHDIEGPLRLVGNLPYNISTPILFHVLAHAGAVRDMHFMLQKEVVERMAAAPGGKVYGRLSVMLQAVCRVVPLFDVPPGAFTPPPKVDSAVVRLLPKPAAEIGVLAPARFEQVVAAAFQQRRKTLRNALSAVCGEEAIRAAGIDPGTRAEQVPVQGFIALANHLAAATPERRADDGASP
ncbi:MAG: 16S rRNA (adenine(1518)-N(6)/adenine(1519)-N(6))-dimethyltransferase RsmA [Xanthomonadaceae bacterium]|jgi:16S rRNA (adenine1518-N6/adenine1519-N6)-dimethyltransferase|nr:16S rRNA (adenine(1518)-N(6)/adenine(1519)-N(6))-dimethyltransferase RsmA [Xanthomonadaceae bacterium]